MVLWTVSSLFFFFFQFNPMKRLEVIRKSVRTSNLNTQHICLFTCGDLTIWCEKGYRYRLKFNPYWQYIFGFHNFTGLFLSQNEMKIMHIYCLFSIGYCWIDSKKKTINLKRIWYDIFVSRNLGSNFANLNKSKKFIFFFVCCRAT